MRKVRAANETNLFFESDVNDNLTTVFGFFGAKADGLCDLYAQEIFTHDAVLTSNNIVVT